ncbi:MAG TPA: ABC transporter permease [Polyangia bacterium]|nr:ABC transporter permease [Polyangia bacterium]
MRETLQEFVSSALRLSTPLLLAATGEMVSEKAGVLNLSLEGMMLSAAFAGALGAKLSGHPLVGLLCGVVAALLLAAVQAVLSVRARANQLVVGIGFNIFALGATTFLYRQIFGGLSREQIPSFGTLSVPILSRLPFLGPALFQQTGLVYAAFLIVGLTWWLVTRTPFGLAVRAAGENPRAADQAGIPVQRVRTLAVLYAGACAGLAGVFISVASISTFTEGMTNGAGYLAVTAVILGGWRSAGVLGACLLFGAASSLQFVLPALGVPIPTAGLVMLPYVLALVAVSGLIRRSRPPAALTLPFMRGGH